MSELSLPDDKIMPHNHILGLGGSGKVSSVSANSESAKESTADGIVGERLTLQAFSQLAGNLAGYPFVKVGLDRADRKFPIVHFINHHRYQFHSDYIAEKILGMSALEMDQQIDAFNKSVYLSGDRRFLVGTLALHQQPNQPNGQTDPARFLSLETVELDTMDAEMVQYFYNTLVQFTDPAVPLLFKPANHLQEIIAGQIDPSILPRVFSHELFSSARFIALNAGSAQGRIRAFKTESEYRKSLPTLEWFDIIVMHRVPDDIPRVAGIINAHHTTPLSHTNVLASGWKIPNAIQIGVFDLIEKSGLQNAWVNYTVENSGAEISLLRIPEPVHGIQRPAWSIQRVKLEQPEVQNSAIVELDQLRMSDRYRYGTKAANLGELKYLLENGSDRLLGFYKVRRPPRPNLLGYIATALGLADTASPEQISKAAGKFLQETIQIPRGIAIPFSVQQQFLESSAGIQQTVGKLKMALELNAREIDSLCLSLQSMIRATRMPDKIRNYIDAQIANALGGVSHFVIRSSSNAEDLENFSAAGIYESINHVTTAENIFQSIKEVWASLLSPRSVRLRHEVGISLDDCYMGVIVQEEMKARMGGVMVTTNPMNRNGDFRNVYINVSPKSVTNIVQGSEMPLQYLYNAVEGGGKTLSIGDAGADLSDADKVLLQKLTFAGRLLQSHFSPDYTFSQPVDIEWIAPRDAGPDFGMAPLCVVQLRPYAK